ncbi:MAG: ParB/RepB/Spo0J family partition protein [Phycisphaerales bacterium]|nr:ParB/RepB/Spo0J family partition protein [Phycisphaerales bacterium]
MAARKVSSKKKAAKKRRLGMGLSGMVGGPVEVKPLAGEAAARAMGDSAAPSPSTGSHAKKPRGTTVSAESGGLSAIPVAEVRPNARQPRHAIDPASLESLVASIRSAGVMQPVVVRPKGADGHYELVAGERRWRAAMEAGLDAVPAIVRQIDDRTAAEWAIIENVQREDLDAVDRGDAFKRLQADFGMTHAEIAEQVGLTRAAVTNQIRLCDLDDGVRSLIRAGALSGGHGRCLLGVVDIDHRLAVAKKAIESEWSVRELERRVRAISKPTTGTSTGKATPEGGRAHLDDLERQLGEYLGTRVRIHTGRKRDRGRLSLEFYDLEQFDGLLGRLGFKPS